jgi:ankyrin repeat protein
MGRRLPNEIYDDAIHRRLDGTCDWILKKPIYVEWKSADFPTGSVKLLWIHGPAGFGKTVLCAKLIEHLSSELVLPPAHFFFSSDFDSRKDPFIAMRTWLSQMLYLPAALEIIRKGRKSHYGQEIPRADLIKLLGDVANAIPGCTFIMDGLDECTSIDGDYPAHGTSSMASFLETMQHALTGTNTRVMIISRNEPEIRRCIIQNTGSKFLEYKISPDDVEHDIASYSRSIVDRRLPNKDEIVRDKISRKLADRCSGQFLWLKMQEPSIRGGKNKKQLQAAIEMAPRGLNRLYDRSWNKILDLPADDSKRAFSILRLAAFALRPLTVAEITEALVTDAESDDLPLDELPETIDQSYIDSEILDLCGSLVEIRGPSFERNVAMKTIHLTHFSVKQYFIHRISDDGNLLIANETLRVSHEAVENLSLAKLCLRYMNFRSIWNEESVSRDNMSGSFRDYAAGSWYRHFHISNHNDSDALQLIRELFNVDNEIWHLWSNWFDLHVEGPSINRPDRQCLTGGPIYYASRLCLKEIVHDLISEQRYDINERTTWGTTALVIACHVGNIDIVKLLLDAGADVAIADCDRWGPLHIACERGDIKIVKLLLESGADISSATLGSWTPLLVACYIGHAHIVKLLLDRGANPSDSNSSGRTSLHMACCIGNSKIAKLLLDKGANVSAVDYLDWTPLHTACCEGTAAELVEVLLEAGADHSVPLNDGWTALHQACRRGSVEIVRLLLKSGADLSAVGCGLTPLQLACKYGHLEIVKVLMDHGAKSSTSPNEIEKPLHLASANGHINVVNFFLELEADEESQRTAENLHTSLCLACRSGHVNVASTFVRRNTEVFKPDMYGRTPLSYACQYGHFEAARLLITLGANVSETIGTSNFGTTLLHLVCEFGFFDIAELLLSKGADIAAQNGDGSTPLHLACESSSLDIVQLLLANGADVSTRDKSGSTALHLACRYSHAGIVRTVVANGADVAAVDGQGSAPLLLTLRPELATAADDYEVHSHLEIAEALIDIGADTAAANTAGQTLLHKAAYNGDVAMVNLLLKKSAEPSPVDGKGWTPLHLACMDDHAEVVTILLQNGAEMYARIDTFGTVLHLACYRGSLKSVLALLQAGFSLDVTNTYGGTPLHVACEQRDINVANALIENREIIDAKDFDGRTAFFWACGMGRLEVVRCLRSAGASTKERDKFGSTPLSVAVRNGHERIAAILLDIEDTLTDNSDMFGRDLLWWAARSGNQQIIHLLYMKMLERMQEIRQEHTQEYNATICDDVTSSLSIHQGKSAKVCDVCIRYIQDTQPRYRCHTCNGGDFDICLDCHKLGARCRSSTHELALRELETPP